MLQPFYNFVAQGILQFLIGRNLHDFSLTLKIYSLELYEKIDRAPFRKKNRHLMELRVKRLKTQFEGDCTLLSITPLECFNKQTHIGEEEKQLSAEMAHRICTAVFLAR